jgi:hypothetical protein
VLLYRNPKTAGMTIYLPGGMLAAGISLYLFYEYNRVKDAKLLARRESLDNVRQQYLQGLIETKKRKPGVTEDLPKANLENEEPENRESN